MSDIFSIEFDIQIFKSLFDDIDFKDIETIIAYKNSLNKINYFFQEFTSLLERPDFINVFTNILYSTKNLSSANEIFDGLNRLTCLTYENQFQIIISFFYSMNERFIEDTKNIFFYKCQDLLKENKSDKLSSNTVQTLLLLIDSNETFKNDIFYKNTFANFLINSQEKNKNSSEDTNKLFELENIIDNTSCDTSIEFEKLLQDLSPLIINNSNNISKPELIDIKLDEKRLASFIIFLFKNQTFGEYKENRFLNKVFLKTLNNDLSMTIDENIEKKININWNVEAFYKMFKNQIDNLNINLIFSSFDDPLFSIKDKKTFEYFISILQKLKFANFQQLLLNLIFKKWNNEINQIDFLNFLINQPDCFVFKICNGRKVKKFFDLNSTINKNYITHLVEAWSCIDMIELLLKLSKGNNYLKIKEMFEWPTINIPEIMVIALAIIKTEGDDFLYEEIINETLPLFLGNHINSITILEEVWNLNKELVIKTICNMYKSHPDLMNLSRILDITQKLKESLIPIVSCNNHNFTVNLAILAVKRDFLHIDQWLAERISNFGDDFIECLLNYINENIVALCKDVTSQSVKESILEKCQLSLVSLAIIFENLLPYRISKNPKVSKRIEKEIINTYNAIFEIFDDLQIQPPNSEEIEDAANKLYQNLFHQEISVEEIIEKMKSYKNSPNQRESEIYACLIHSLLNEYRFFHQYPERELVVIATLFGQIINQKLLDGVLETIALKYVLEGIKKGNGNMFTFATTALEQYVDKLQASPHYISSLINLPALKNNQFLYNKINEKFNEIIARSKIKAEDSIIILKDKNTSQINQKNIIDNDQEHKKANIKMQHINKEKFTTSYFNMTNASYVNSSFNLANNITNVNQSNLLNKSKTENTSNLKGLHNSQYLGKDNKESNYQEFQKNSKVDKNEYNFHSTIKLKQDQENELKINQANLNNLNLEDKSIFNTKTILLKPTNNQSNVGKISGISGERETFIQVPSQEIIDKINFIFNSMSKNNISDKSNEIKAILNNENVVKWFSNFFIVNRISVESNNHQIYFELITYIDSRDLNRLMIKETITYIKKLLLSENLAKDAKEKRLLTNLGSWLGAMTLANNKPILAKDLDLKETIFDAYENGKLTAIIAFVCKIIEHSTKTKVFHSKNPWIQAILSLLAELYFLQNLKTNLKFEIENIFKRLEIDLSSFPQSRLLDSIAISSISQDFTPKSLISQVPSKTEPELNSDELNKILSKQDHYLNEILQLIARTQVIQFSKNELLIIITNSLYNAINEIIAPVVERAVNISQVTTRELILKDFTFEKDENKFKTAANLCIKSLAGSLSMVTCKEPLRIGYNNQLKEILNKKGIESETIDSMNNSINNSEILEIGSNFIQNYVIKTAIDKIEKDKIIIQELEKRRKNNLSEVKSEFLLKIKSLPEVLRPNPNGLTSNEMKIYEDFDKIYDRNSEGINLNSKMSLLKKIIPALKEVIDSLNSNNIINKYEMCMKNIMFITKSENVEYLDEDDQLLILSKMISDFKVNDIAIALELFNVSFKYIVIASKIHNSTLVNINSEILKGWVKLHPQLAKETTNKLLNSEDIYIRFKLDIHYYFFKKNIFNMNDYENFILNYLQECSMTSFVRKLIAGLLEKNVLPISNFKKIPNYMIDPSLSNHYFNFFAKKSTFCVPDYGFSILDAKMWNNKSLNSFNKLIDNCKYDAKTLINFAYQNFDQELIRHKSKVFLENSSILKNEEQMNSFIVILTELSVRSFLFYEPENFFYPEVVAKVIIFILNNVQTNKLKLFENILFGIFKVFHYDYSKNQANFNQKPYYKLLINLMYHLHSMDTNEHIFKGCKRIQFFYIIADVLRFMKPLNYPGFVLAWIDLISSNYFSLIFLEPDSTTSKFTEENINRYEKYMYLLIDLLSFLKVLSNDILGDYNSKVIVDSIYKFIFLLNSSYPEFLSYYYYIIIISLPQGDTFLQIKNIILHSAPLEIEQPPPFIEELKVDTLPDIRKNSTVLFDIVSILNEYGYNSILDEYIESKNESYIEELLKKLNKKDRDQYQNYIVINCIVIYFAQYNVKNNIENKKMSNQEILEFFVKMIKNLDADNRDHLINSILNELRYPSSQTYFFSCLILILFSEIKNGQIEEHILKNILERLLYRPYPWGVLVTFLEFYRHPKYELSKKSYIIKTQSDKIIEELVQFLKSSKQKKILENYVT